MPVSPARAAAFDILLRVEQRQAYATELLNSARTAELSPADRALCMELTMGVLRWRSRLDDALAAVVSQRLEKLDIEVLTALRLAAYQLEFLRVPARAAVNESVELVKRARKRSAAPLVNAALRKLSAKDEPPVLPQEPQSALDLSQSYAHPLWLVERWGERYGMVTAATICAHNQQNAATALRLRDHAAEDELRREGIRLDSGALLTSARRIVGRQMMSSMKPTERPIGRQTDRPNDLLHSRVFREGRAAIQDEASQLVALLVGRGARLLDCCAAPGGKTAILAERNPGALLVAADIHPHRARLMRELLAVSPQSGRALVAQGDSPGRKGAHPSSPAGTERLSRVLAPPVAQPGATQLPRSVHIISADALQLPLRLSFDRVLADVPCSGTGTLARNPEIKWRLTPESLAELHALQVAILRSALAALAPGGRLVYSTCSLEPEENERVVEEALAGGAFRVLPARQELERMRRELAWPNLDSLCEGPYLRTIPGVHPCDGFFAAIIAEA